MLQNFKNFGISWRKYFFIHLKLFYISDIDINSKEIAPLASILAGILNVSVAAVISLASAASAAGAAAAAKTAGVVGTAGAAGIAGQTLGIMNNIRIKFNFVIIPIY